MRQTMIEFNGSKFAGQEPADLETLFALLAKEPLEPDFAKTCFEVRVFSQLPYTHQFRGNFFAVSHAFSVFTEDPTVIERFQNLIVENLASDAFKAASLCREKEEARQEHFTTQRKKGLRY